MAKGKPGKYDHVLPGLRRDAPEDVKSCQDEINAVKAKVTDRDARSMAIEYAKLRRARVLLDEEISALFIQIKAYEQLLADSQERQAAGWGDYGVKDNAIKLADGAVVRVRQRPQGKVVDAEAFRIWCIENGYERQLSLHPSRMDSIVKERLVAGEAPPDGTEAVSYTQVSYGKGDDD